MKTIFANNFEKIYMGLDISCHAGTSIQLSLLILHTLKKTISFSIKNSF
jgi:hypothetical protein